MLPREFLIKSIGSLHDLRAAFPHEAKRHPTT